MSALGVETKDEGVQPGMTARKSSGKMDQQQVEEEEEER